MLGPIRKWLITDEVVLLETLNLFVLLMLSATYTGHIVEVGSEPLFFPVVTISNCLKQCFGSCNDCEFSTFQFGARSNDELQVSARQLVRSGIQPHAERETASILHGARPKPRVPVLFQPREQHIRTGPHSARIAAKYHRRKFASVHRVPTSSYKKPGADLQRPEPGHQSGPQGQVFAPKALPFPVGTARRPGSVLGHHRVGGPREGRFQVPQFLRGREAVG